MYMNMYSGQECGRGQDATFDAECSLAAAVAWWKFWLHSVFSERTRGWLLFVVSAYNRSSPSQHLLLL